METIIGFLSSLIVVLILHIFYLKSELNKFKVLFKEYKDNFWELYNFYHNKN